MNEATEKLLNIAQTVEFLNISRTRLWQLCGTKTTPQEIAFYELGKRRLFSKEKHLEPYLKKHEKPVEEISTSATTVCEISQN